MTAPTATLVRNKLLLAENDGNNNCMVMNVAAFNLFVIYCINATTQYLPFEVSLVYSIEFASN